MANKFVRERKRVSIVIPIWIVPNQNGKYGENEVATITSICIKRLMEVTPRELFDLILVDNGSDWRIEGVSEIFSHADVLIKNKHNLGFARGCNMGLCLARNSEFVILMNDDLLVFDHWLEILINDFEYLEKNATVKPGLIMPALCKSRIGSEDKLGFWDMVNMKKDGSEISMPNKGKFGQGAEFGSCFMGRKELFDKVAKFRDSYQVLDENFLIGFGEDRLLWTEVRKLGFDTWRTHSIRVAHCGGLSMSKVKNIPENRKMIDGNREYLQKKKNEYAEQYNNTNQDLMERLAEDALVD